MLSVVDFSRVKRLLCLGNLGRLGETNGRIAAQTQPPNLVIELIPPYPRLPRP